MSEAPPGRRRQGFWLTVGEIVAVLALAIAGLNYWETHQQHVAEVRRASAEARAQAAFVVTGVASPDGRRVKLQSLKSAQAIQSQRYVFPKAVLDHPMEVAAAQPQIDIAWVEPGLRRALAAAHIRRSGEATLPLAIASTYVEDGETRTDRSVYQIGWAWKPDLFGAMRIRLQGISLMRRGVSDSRPVVEQRWTTTKTRLGTP